MVRVQKKTAAQWRDTVYSMIGRGGHILPDEIEPITAYLTANFGPDSRPAAAAGQAPGAPAPAGAAASLAQQLPEAPGKAILVRTCQQCHDLKAATTRITQQDSWDSIVGRMLSLGARMTPEERQELVRYLGSLAEAR
jgi:3-oxoacyl-ACP reductase-like protein